MLGNTSQLRWQVTIVKCQVQFNEQYLSVHDSAQDSDELLMCEMYVMHWSDKCNVVWYVRDGDKKVLQLL